MQSTAKKNLTKIGKLIIAGVLTLTFTNVTSFVKAQGPPPPPPPPSEVFRKAGAGLKKINPFKKSRKHARRRTNGPGMPPPPPNPLHLKRPGLPPPPPRP